MSTVMELEAGPDPTELETSTSREHASFADRANPLDLSIPREVVHRPERSIDLNLSTPRELAPVSEPVRLAVSMPEQVVSIPSSPVPELASQSTAVADHLISLAEHVVSVARVRFVDSEVLESAADFSGDDELESDVTDATSIEALSETESTSVIDEPSELDKSVRSTDSSFSSSKVITDIYFFHGQPPREGESERSEVFDSPGSPDLSSASRQYLSEEELDPDYVRRHPKRPGHPPLSESDGDTSETDIEDGESS
jgi:hypothetical protein